MIPKYPTKLQGSFWGLTSFYNPCGYKNKRKNYRRFRESLKKQGLKLLCVELAFNGSGFELEKTDAEILVQLKTSAVLWHKERLLNIGLKHLPADCDKIAWLDADIIFCNESWVEQTAELLESYVVVQPYSFMMRLPKKFNGIKFDKVPLGNAEGQKLHGIGYGIANFGNGQFSDFLKHGHTGFAWTARRSIFTQHGFYDRMVLGSGDSLMSHAFYNNKNSLIRELSSPEMVADQDRWIDKIYTEVKSSVYYTDGFILHLWHGQHRNKLYFLRFAILKKSRFDPQTDIELDERNCWSWATDKRKLHLWAEKYFWLRNEEGALFYEIILLFYKLNIKWLILKSILTKSVLNYKSKKLRLIWSGSDKEFYLSLFWIMRFLRKMGIKPVFFVITAAAGLFISLLEGIGIGLLLPVAKGILAKNFTFVRNFITMHLPLPFAAHFLSSDISIFATLLTLVFLASLLKNILKYFSGVAIIAKEQKLASNIRKFIFSRYMAFGKLFFDRSNIGNLSQTISTSTTIIAKQLILLEQVPTAVFSLVVYAAIMLLVSGKLAFIALLSIPIINYSSRWIVAKVKEMSMLHSQGRKELMSAVANLLSCIGLVKLYQREEKEKLRFNVTSDALAKVECNMGKEEQLLLPLQDTLLMLLQLVLISLMLVIAMKGKPGQLAEFLIFLYALRKSVANIGVFGKAGASLAKAAGPLQEIAKIMDDQDKFFIPDGKKEFRGIHRGIKFQGLNFSYLKEVPVLKGISFSIERGKMTALVGPTGAGKTTIVSLLMRFYDCGPSAILIDGTDIRDFNLASLRAQLAMATQEPLLFNDTIRANITYGIDDVSEEDLITAVKKARLYDFIAALPAGLDTDIGDRGIKLSGGEKQRLSIARALLKGAEILILDEATSSLDTKTETLIQEAINEAIKDRTSIVIAHRFSTIKNADKIIVIEEGRVMEQGTLEELLKKKGKFYAYWQAQKFY